MNKEAIDRAIAASDKTGRRGRYTSAAAFLLSTLVMAGIVSFFAHTFDSRTVDEPSGTTCSQTHVEKTALDMV